MAEQKKLPNVDARRARNYRDMTDQDVQEHLRETEALLSKGMSKEDQKRYMDRYAKHVRDKLASDIESEEKHLGKRIKKKKKVESGDSPVVVEGNSGELRQIEDPASQNNENQPGGRRGLLNFFISSGSDAFRKTYPGLSKVIDFFFEKEQKQGQERRKQADRADRLVQESEATGDSVKGLHRETRKTNDLLKELLDTVKTGGRGSNLLGLGTLGGIAAGTLLTGAAVTAGGLAIAGGMRGLLGNEGEIRQSEETLTDTRNEQRRAEQGDNEPRELTDEELEPTVAQIVERNRDNPEQAVRDAESLAMSVGYDRGTSEHERIVEAVRQRVTPPAPAPATPAPATPEAVTPATPATPTPEAVTPATPAPATPATAESSRIDASLAIPTSFQTPVAFQEKTTATTENRADAIPEPVTGEDAVPDAQPVVRVPGELDGGAAGFLSRVLNIRADKIKFKGDQVTFDFDNIMNAARSPILAPQSQPGGASGEAPNGGGRESIPQNNGLPVSFGGALQTAPAGQATPQATAPVSGNLIDLTDRVNFNFGSLTSKSGFVVHHTAGRGTAEGVLNTFRQRNFPTQYIIDREGRSYRVLRPGMQGQHMREGQGVGQGLNNTNTEGVEVIANDDSDVLPVQVAAAQSLVSSLGYSPNQVFGHGEVNPHKQRTEGATIVRAIKGGAGEQGGERVDNAPSSPGEAEGGGGENQQTPGATPTPATGAPTSGAAVASASAADDMSTRAPGAATSPPAEGGGGQENPSTGVPNYPVSEGDPGPVEPEDAASRYAQLFGMAA